jgi:tetratricopeptide (TPR) repeat protein
MRARWFWLLPLLFALTHLSPAQQWFSVQTTHLISYSDNGRNRDARQAAEHSEQLIAAFGEILNRKEITFSPPLRVLVNHASLSSAALIRTPDANVIMIDFSQPDSWPQAAKLIVALTLEDNYPRAHPWFDCGIVSYLAGVQFNRDQMQIGGPPPGMHPPRSDKWIPIAKLFTINDLSRLSAAQRATFEAESWAVVRWLIDNNRMPQASAYLNAAQMRNATPEQALDESFSMSSAAVDLAVRESLEKLSAKSVPAPPRIESRLLKPQKVSSADAHVIEANLSLFGHEQARTLNGLIDFMHANQENVAVHRTLAWAFLLRNDLGNAVEHIRRALALDDSDPAMHYLYARWANRGDGDRIRVESAEARMGTELKAALKLDPNYAPALELLGLAELSGDNTKVALAHLQRASALCPRNSRYSLNLGRAYEASGNLEAAHKLMLYARSDGDAAISKEAEQSLNQLGKPRKQQPQWLAMKMDSEAANVEHSKYDNLQDAIAEEEKEEARRKKPVAPPDMRKTEYMKGRIVGVECASPPGAILRVRSAGRIWHMHVSDRNTIVLIGVDHFDCGWHNTAVSINYKRRGNLQGDLVSLEAN